MPGDLDMWLDEHGVLDGQPFLIGPDVRYDISLNRYFEQARMSTHRGTPRPRTPGI